MYLEIVKKIEPNIDMEEAEVKLHIKRRLTKKEMIVLENDYQNIDEVVTLTNLSIDLDRLGSLRKSAIRKIKQKVVVDIAHAQKENVL
jgi:predicted GTPase